MESLEVQAPKVRQRVTWQADNFGSWMKLLDNELGVWMIPRQFHRAGSNSQAELTIQKDRYFPPNWLEAKITAPASAEEAG
jgi:hypothetical protein